MAKYFCTQIHTERLHDDRAWKQVHKILAYLRKHNISATWFSINPTFVGYRAMEFDERKWKERLRIIAEYGHDIQQHTHFYKGKEGVPKGEGYDLSEDHIRARLLEDKKWLEEQGLSIKGFVSGAWFRNDDLFKILAGEGYLYDSSIKGSSIVERFGVLEIPSSARVRKLLFLKFSNSFIKISGGKVCTLSFHDYDLENFIFRNAFLLILTMFRAMGFKFISENELYEKLK